MSILGPVRSATQVELSLTDARSIGVTAPVRESGDIAGSGACKLVCETIENTGKGDKVSNLSAPLLVMAGEDMPAGPTDPIFNRLLKDRIIWMGEEVKDEMANRICAQMLMLAAEDPKLWICWMVQNISGRNSGFPDGNRESHGR